MMTCKKIQHSTWSCFALFFTLMVGMFEASNLSVIRSAALSSAKHSSEASKSSSRAENLKTRSTTITCERLKELQQRDTCFKIGSQTWLLHRNSCFADGSEVKKCREKQTECSWMKCIARNWFFGHEGSGIELLRRQNADRRFRKSESRLVAQTAFVLHSSQLANSSCCFKLSERKQLFNSCVSYNG